MVLGGQKATCRRLRLQIFYTVFTVGHARTEDVAQGWWLEVVYKPPYACYIIAQAKVL